MVLPPPITPPPRLPWPVHIPFFPFNITRAMCSLLIHWFGKPSEPKIEFPLPSCSLPPLELVDNPFLHAIRTCYSPPSPFPPQMGMDISSLASWTVVSPSFRRFPSFFIIKIKGFFSIPVEFTINAHFVITYVFFPSSF